MPLLEEIVALQPEDLNRGNEYAIWFLELYYAFLDQEEFTEADKVLQQAEGALWNSPEGLNRIAWSLACPPKIEYQRLAKSIELVNRAIELTPDEERYWNAQTYWNTLGYAQYCSADYEAAVESLTRAVEKPYGGVVYNHLFLAMACGQIGDQETGLQFYRLAVEWTEENTPADAWLTDRFREAADMLGTELRPFLGPFESEVDKIPIVSESDLTEAIRRSRERKEHPPVKGLQKKRPVRP